MRNKLIILCFSYLLSSCGISTHSVNNCIPQTPFISTKEIGFVSYRPNKEFMNGAYDELEIGNTQDWYLSINDLINPSYQIFSGDPYIEEELPEGSQLILSGRAKIRDSWGLMTAFNSDMVYLHGTIESRNVWVPAFMFREFKNSKNSKNEFYYRNSELEKLSNNRTCNQPDKKWLCLR